MLLLILLGWGCSDGLVFKLCYYKEVSFYYKEVRLVLLSTLTRPVLCSLVRNLHKDVMVQNSCGFFVITR